MLGAARMHCTAAVVVAGGVHSTSTGWLGEQWRVEDWRIRIGGGAYALALAPGGA